MNLSLEVKAMGWAILVALFSLASAWLAADPIKMLASSNASPSEVASVEISSAPEILDEGQHFFGESCSQCHGDDAHGDEGPDLHNLAISNARIATTIRRGIKGEMPPFAKKYNDRQIAALVSYLRTLR